MFQILRKTTPLIAACAFLGACAVSETGHYTTSKQRDEPVEAVATDPAQVQLYTGTPPQAFTELEPIRVTVNKLTVFHPNPTVAQVEEALKEKAAELGASAVMKVEITGIHVSPLSWGARTGKGIAITY